MDFDFTSKLNYNKDKSTLLLLSLQYEIIISLGLVVYLRNFQFSECNLQLKILQHANHHIIFQIL